MQLSQFDRSSPCGPTPMMKAVARYAKEKGIACEVSLENLMACGLGACLCCVEKVKADADASDTVAGHLSDTVAGHSSDAVATNVCVCKEGPVFNINRLLWQN